MARNLFTQNPVDAANEELLGRVRDTAAASPAGIKQTAPAPADTPVPTSPREFFDGLASETKLPPNLIWSLAESTAKDGTFDPDAVRGQTAKLQKLMAEGRDTTQALAMLTGDPKTADALMNRAYAIADFAYPTPEKQAEDAARNDNYFATDAVNIGVGGAIEGTGMALKLGSQIAGGSEAVYSDPKNAIEKLTNLVDAPARGISWLFEQAGGALMADGKNVRENVSDTTKDAMAGSEIKGNVFKPSTWTMGENPSLRGLSALTVGVLGNLAPVLIAGGVAGPAGAMMAGAGQGGEGAAQNARETLEGMAESGELQANSSYYQDLIAAGVPEDQAVKRTIKAAEKVSSLLAAPIAGLGGAFTSGIVQKGVGALAGRGIATRVAGTAGISAVEEGSQEVAESVAGVTGINLATGMGLDPYENTFGDFVMGAMAGGPLGALGGIRGEGEADAPDVRPALEPAPPAPDQGTLDPVAAPVPLPAMAEAAPVVPAAGPLEAAQASAPPAVAEPVEAIQRFPDMKPGLAVTLRDGDGRDIPVTFLREDDGMIVVRDRGQELSLSDEEFDTARIAALEEKPKAAEKVAPEVKPEPIKLPDSIEETRRLIDTAIMANVPDAELVSLENHLSVLLADEREAAPEPESPKVAEIANTWAEPLTKNNGEPFISEDAARLAVKRRGLTPDDFTYDPEKGGVVANPKPQGETNAPNPSDSDLASFPYYHDRPRSLDGTDGSESLAVPGNDVDAPTGTAGPAETVEAGPAETDQGPNVADAGISEPDVEQPPADAASARPAASGVTDAPVQGDRPSVPVTKDEKSALVAEFKAALKSRDDVLDAGGDIADTTEQVKALKERLVSMVGPEAAELIHDRADKRASKKAKDTPSTVAPKSAADADPTSWVIRDKATGEAVLETSDRAKIDALNAAKYEAVPIKDHLASINGQPKLAPVEPTVDTPAAPAADLSIKDIRAKAAVLTGRPQTDKPKVGNVNFTWDAKAGGWIFSRARKAEVEEALGMNAKAEEVLQNAPQNMPENMPDANPTDAQKEAGNYQMGHVRWNGLDISIETAKGSERTGTDGGGKKWSVKMPANYGYFKGTTGADGDHIDVYQGDNPDSDAVVIVNQVDAETGAFDEHKIIVGIENASAALAIYEAGFSDGKGKDRIGSFTEMNVADFKEWLEGGDHSKPTAPVVPRKSGTVEEVPKAEDTAEDGASEPDQGSETSEEATTPVEGKDSVSDGESEENGRDDGSEVDETAKARRAAINPNGAEANRVLEQELAAEVAKAGLSKRVSVRFVKALMDPEGRALDGQQAGSVITVSYDAADPVATINHEIVHVLRDQAVWDKEFGLFTREEWQALVAAARADKKLMAKIEAAYPDLTASQRIEEAVAELYGVWKSGKRNAATSGALKRIADVLRAIGRVFRSKGWKDAEAVMQAIGRGDIGARGPDGPDGSVAADPAPRDTASLALAESLEKSKARRRAIVGDNAAVLPTGKDGWITKSQDYISNAMTDLMGTPGRFNALALIPGRPLFAELGKDIKAAQRYLVLKEKMDALRNDKQESTADVADAWMALNRTGKAENATLMDLMHRATLSGIDPTKDYEGPADDAKALVDHEKMQAEFKTLPEEHREMFTKVATAYDTLATEFEDAVIENIKKSAQLAINRAEREHTKEVARISDEGLTGEARDDARADADRKLANVKARGGWSLKSRLNGLRAEFESNRLLGPYFPLARFGNYFVTLRDDDGKVVSFSRFEKEADQKAFLNSAEAKAGKAEHGVLTDQGALQKQVDPGFLADVQNLLGEHKASPDLMDSIWQKWLETLPDQSIRTSRIHRKGTRGYQQDALRAFSHHQFHGAHQLARLKYSVEMTDELEKAAEEAKDAKDPNRATMLVNEMMLRHQYTMQPMTAAWATKLTSLAFVWYLAATPAAAIVNVSQTTVLGPGIMGAAFPKQGVRQAIKELGRASKQFGQAKFNYSRSDALTSAEKAAVDAAERRGVIDKTRAHDLANVAENGIEYRPATQQVMQKISWMFHVAEVANRSVTFLAGYRMAVADGKTHEEAIEQGSDITWKTHFDYQNSSRPRFMTGDTARVFTTFRQYSVNLIFRMARDIHQAFVGDTPEIKAEARKQFVSVSLSMLAHAGIKGVWGYAIIKTALALVIPGADDDDLERWMQDAFLMENPEGSVGPAAWNYVMGAALNGIPGQVAGVDLTQRLGSPTLWFRENDRNLEGEDLLNERVIELLGPVVGIGFSAARGIQYASEATDFMGYERAVETASPKAVRDLMKAARYAYEGVQSRKGNDIISDDNVDIGLIIKQAMGFTPIEVAEQYAANSRMYNRNNAAIERRSRIQGRIAKHVIKGEPIPERLFEQMLDFNAEWPRAPITSDTIRQSIKSKIRADAKNESGASLDPRLNDKIRAEEAPLIYQ